MKNYVTPNIYFKKRDLPFYFVFYKHISNHILQGTDSLQLPYRNERLPTSRRTNIEMHNAF